MDEHFGPAALAIYGGDLDQLTALLRVDAGLASRRSSVSHPTLLQLVACEEPKIADPVGAASALLDAGAPTHLPLIAAAGCGSMRVLEFLIDSGVDVDGGDPAWSALDEALYWAQRETTALLHERGARIRALSTAAGLGDMAAINQFFPDGELSPSAGPIGSPFEDTVPSELANDSASIVDHAFVMAANTGQQEAAERLLREGAPVNATPPGYHHRGTALHAAVWRGNRELVEWLLSIGADPELRDGLANSNALGWAQHNNHPELIKLLDA